MPAQLALGLCLVYILWLLFKEVRERKGVSHSIWVVVIWAVIIGSRPVTTWFSFGGTSGGEAEAYDSGNPFERMIYFVLILYGLFVVFRRGVQLGEIIRTNQVLFVFCLYWGLSVLWSEFPIVALKRWVKDVGNIVMVLVVLTEAKPVEAAKAVFVRCGSLLVPLSVVFIKCYGNLGRAYHSSTGEMMYTGVTTHKNMLGVVVMVCGMFQIWDFLERWRDKSARRDWTRVAGDLSLLLMTFYLMQMSHSATALGCMVVGIVIFFALGRPAVRARVGNLGLYGTALGLGLWMLDSAINLKKLIIVDILGRDMTLTTRTEVWPLLLSQSESVLLGSGFCSFWAGERLAVIYNKMGIIQAHNGYLETYLNGGLIAVVLLVMLLFSAGKNIKRELMLGSEFARIKFAFLVIAVIYDFTEAAFNKMGLVWFVLLLAIVRYWPELQFATNEQAVEEEEEGEPVAA